MSGDYGALGCAVWRECDTLVVGAGPAGLFAALQVSRAANLRVLVIDAGRDVDERENISMSELHSDDLISGVGGAGLYSDGKLCLSLAVGGDLSLAIPSDQRGQLLNEVASVLHIDPEFLTADQPDIQDETESASAVGLDFTYYPVMHLGTEYCKGQIIALSDQIRALGTEIFSETRLVSLEKQSDGVFRALISRAEGCHVILARRVVLAMGKVGADQERKLCVQLGAKSRRRPMYVGVRLEADANAHKDLFATAVDPKYKLSFSDGSKIKMHCATNGGEVLPLFYDGLPLAGGHAYHDKSSDRSSFGVLWDGVRFDSDAYSFAFNIMKRSAEEADGKLLVQRLADYLEKRPSNADDVRRAHPSIEIWTAGDLRRILPEDYFVRFDAFLAALARLGHQFEPETTLLFAPAIEWWMERIETDRNLSVREVGGLYVAGDGSGWSQGIVHSAATGLVVADAILKSLSTAGMLERL